MTIEELILGFQEGMLENFDIIHENLWNERDMLFKFFRKKLPSAFSEHDILAMLDDSLLDAVSAWSPSYGTKFTTYWCGIATNKKNNMLRHMRAERDPMDTRAVHGTLNAPSIVTDSFVEVDVMHHERIWNLQESVVFNEVMRFYCSSQKNAQKAMYILLDAFCDYTTAEQKYSEMRRVMQCEYPDATIRKRISRAKRDLKLFLEKV